MTPAHLKLTVPLTLLFLALALIARAVGSTQPLNPALEGFILGCEDKPQPCWYGIVPGLTTVEEAAILLRGQGLFIEVEHRISTETSQTHVLTINNASDLLKCDVVSFVDSNDGANISFRQCSNLEFGQLYFLIEYPGGLRTDGCINEIYFSYPNALIIISLAYKNLPLLHQSAPVISFAIYPTSSNTVESMKAILDDQLRVAFAPDTSWHYLKLVYIDVTGCG